MGRAVATSGKTRTRDKTQSLAAKEKGKPSAKKAAKPDTGGRASGTSAKATAPAEAKAANGMATSRKASVRRDEIVRAAASVFAQKGYAETTLGDVAERLNIHTAGLYYYFENKDAVVEAVLRYAASRMLERTGEALEAVSGGSPRERLRAYVTAYLQVSAHRDDIGKAFWKIIDQVSPELRETCAAEAKVNFGMWRDLVEAAASDGSIRTDIPPSILRSLIIGSIMWLPEWYRRDGSLSVDQIADMLMSLFGEPPAARKPAKKRAVE